MTKAGKTVPQIVESYMFMAGDKAERVQASFPTDLAGPARLNFFFIHQHPEAVRNLIPQ